MAQLTNEQKIELSAELQREWSSVWTVIPLSKDNLALMLDVFDAGMESAEAAIVEGVSPTARAWLLAHIPLARFVLQKVAQKRQEVL